MVVDARVTTGVRALLGHVSDFSSSDHFIILLVRVKSQLKETVAHGSSIVISQGRKQSDYISTPIVIVIINITYYCPFIFIGYILRPCESRLKLSDKGIKIILLVLPSRCYPTQKHCFFVQSISLFPNPNHVCNSIEYILSYQRF